MVALLGSNSKELRLEREMSLQTFRINMTGNFNSVEDLIAACKRLNSIFYWKIKDLEGDYFKGRDKNNTLEKLEEIYDTLEALDSVVQ